MNNFQDTKIDVKIKIVALWISIMFLYLYNDFFSLFTPGSLQSIMDGNMGPFPVTQLALFNASLLMAVPSVMVFLTLILKPRVNRIVNIILGFIYIAVMVASVIGEWAYYYFMGVIEIILTGTIVWFAIKWPKKID